MSTREASDDSHDSLGGWSLLARQMVDVLDGDSMSSLGGGVFGLIVHGFGLFPDHGSFFVSDLRPLVVIAHGYSFQGK